MNGRYDHRKTATERHVSLSVATERLNGRATCFDDAFFSLISTSLICSLKPSLNDTTMKTDIFV